MLPTFIESEPLFSMLKDSTLLVGIFWHWVFFKWWDYFMINKAYCDYFAVTLSFVFKLLRRFWIFKLQVKVDFKISVLIKWTKQVDINWLILTILKIRFSP